MARNHVAVTAVLFSSLLFGCAQKQIAVTPDGRVHGVITHVTDGDTVDVRFGSNTEKIRLIGVDTPETKHPTKPVGCWGPEASAHTTALLPPGTDVYIVRDAEARDKY
ncbi:MAG: nuclease, partial [Actinobacteria bacterium]|nr:nuclease [Actinomycetota bacterium]